MCSHVWIGKGPVMVEVWQVPVKGGHAGRPAQAAGWVGWTGWVDFDGVDRHVSDGGVRTSWAENWVRPLKLARRWSRLRGSIFGERCGY